ncbi:uncharacterized protein EI90DRAFT_3123251 [Cantharellus anzutake]|uniref:uncharacterized protein n=1 Tax=Cantharellus anzutake TaxID=1750568 RepID=UPI0019060742|nr:uncharacterized protein EI90DRAFT_3123251 [Cantharellus anzutake]KAF8331674.1 hypothetical protein EI90DRAFT_3123251 [Cantharellus anzutake]
MLDIDWSDPQPARPGHQRAASLWTKVKNSISILKPEPGTLPPPPRRSNSDPRSSSSRSKSVPRTSYDYRAHERHQSQSPPRTYQPQIRVQTGHGSPRIYTPTSPTKGYSYNISRGAAPAPVRRSTQPTSAPVRSTPQRSKTVPSNGVMYNGKLIVGNSKDVERYISSQRRIENWSRNVR